LYKRNIDKYLLKPLWFGIVQY